MENWEAGDEVAAEERFSFEDSDRFDEESLCSFMSEPESLCTNWRGWKRQSNSLALASGNQNGEMVPSLMDLCAKAVALHIPFEQVEKMYPPVPENVQLRIAYWSFPANEEDIRLYSCLANGSSDEFQRGEHFVRAKCVGNVLQIGFHLSGDVNPPASAINKTQCCVAVTFDRCKITSCSCNCGLNAKWCAHVVALCLLRIQQPTTVCFRAPVSESLSRLHRDQLQKFAQYLISELPQQILPTAQRLLDELLSSDSTVINTLSGAPDPTAGPSMVDKSLWYLDENALNDNIKKTLVKFCGPTPIVYSDVNFLYLSSTEPPAAAEYSSLLRPLRGREPEGIWNLLSIVREMLKRRDSNAVLLLDIVTEQCLCFEQVAIWWYNTRTSSSSLQSGSGGHPSSHRPSNNISSDIAQHAAASMCDEIVTLWRLIILGPVESTLIRKKELKTRLLQFHDKTLEIIKRGKYKDAHLAFFTGFKPAIDACNFDWAATEILLCNHIVRKSRQTKPLAPTQQPRVSESRPRTFNKEKLNRKSLVLPIIPEPLNDAAKGKKATASHRLSLRGKHIDAGSASDDSCIERDFETLHIGGGGGRTHGWGEITESPLDFTSDDGSSAGSPDHFNMSSSDENDLSTNATSLREKTQASSKSKLIEPTKNSTLDSVETEDLRLKKYREELDALFTRAESLYAYGRSREACELATKLAEEVLNNPEELITEPGSLQGDRKAWIRLSTSYACKSMERALFLCTVLSEHQRHHTLAFRVGLQGLDLKRLPASSKTLEVKLFYQQGELAALMKRLPLGPREVAKLQEKANWLALVDSSHDFIHVLPLRLATFVFDAFCQPTPSGRSSGNLKVREISSSDQELGFEAAVNALGFKVNVSEAEHPLLCEGTRKLKGELAMQLLILYKDQQHKLRTILDNLLDKSLSSNLRASSAFPQFGGSSRRTTSFSSGLSQSSSRSQLSPTSDHVTPLGTVSTGQVPMNLNVDESTDDDGARSNRSPYSDVDNSLPGPHGDVKSSTSCDDDYPSSSTVCSPPRRDAKMTYRSPTVRPKRKQHCLANVNSSASEEAMLSDTSPRTRRRNLNNGLLSNFPHSMTGSAWASGRYPSSPSSDSGSSISNDSMGTSSGENKRNFDNGRNSQPNRSPLRADNPSLPPASNNRAGYNYKKTRGRNLIAVPDIPNQPSEAGAHFFFELAKNVFVKAGGNSSTSLFMQQPQGNGQSGVHRNLVLAAFEIGLYALGLHNCVSPNWLSRTYSSHVSWITGQAMEIGSAALHILVDSWEGHLTPPETASLADRASRGRDSTTVRRAAELALSVLPRAHALNPSEIQRALLQCREQGVSMLEKACYEVEQAGRGGGVYPEILFEVARQWDWIYQKVNESGDNAASRPAAAAPPALVNAFPTPPVTSGAIVAVSQPPSSNTVTNQNIPASVGGMVLPGGVVTIQDPRLPMQCHPTPVLHGFGPPLLDHQLSGHQIPGVTAGMQPLHQYPTIHLNPVTAINLVPMPAVNLHALQYHPAPGAFLPDPHAAALHHHHQNAPPPMPPIPAITMPPVSSQLQSSFRVGMLALDLLTKRTEDRPIHKYTRNPPYAANVMWLMNLSIKLGIQYVQQFCMAAVGGISSPYVLQDIAVEAAKFLSEQNNQPICTNLRAAFILPIMTRCLQMYAHFIHNRLYHLHPSTNQEEFVALVHTARGAFCMTPGGMMQFNDVLQSIHRSKSCSKDLWQKINAGLHA